MAPATRALAGVALSITASALAPPPPRAARAPPLRAEPFGDFNPLEKLEEMTDAWRNKGWQLRKRKGSFFPELLPQPGLPGWAGDEATAAEAAALDATPLTEATSRDNWLASSTAGARALSAPDAREGSKELAVAGDFSAFLARPEVATRYERTEEGAIVFADEGALAATVAVFATELTRELGAAARALARYVDDLEAELAAADEGAVLLRSQLADAERAADDRTSVAEAEAARAREARELAASAEAARRAAEAEAAEAEERADRSAAELAERAAKEGASEEEVRAARAAAVELETRLVDAEAKFRERADEAAAVARRAAAAERQAAAAAGEKEATEAVLDAMKLRAEAAERTAEDAAARAREAFERAEESEAKLRKELAAVTADVESPDAATAAVVADAERATADLTKVAKAPALSKMRKADLVAECVSRGLDATGLKVPELRVMLRAARAEAKAASGATAAAKPAVPKAANGAKAPAANGEKAPEASTPPEAAKASGAVVAPPAD